MGKECHLLKDTIRLYTAQMPVVLDALERDGVCMSKSAYVERKYQESARSFLIVYQWFAEKAAQLVPRPEGAELPYWAFADLYNVDASDTNEQVLTMEVPVGEAVLFDMYDWTKLLQLSYLGETEQEEREFKEQLRQCGLTEYDVMMSRFYPEWQQKIYASWERLFRHHHALQAGDESGVRSVQAALWKLDKKWVEKA